MLMSLKSVIRSLLPVPLLSQAHACKEKFLLSQCSSLPFSVSQLVPANQFDLSRILNNPDSLSSWETDRKEIESFHPANDLWGGVNPGDRRALYSLIRGLNPTSVLEVGTHIGSSTLHLARALKTNNAGGHLDTVDIYDVNDPQCGAWKSVGAPASPAAMMQAMGLSDIVTFHTSGSLNYIKSTDKKFDVIFLDGDHSATAVYNEVSASLPVLTSGGIVILHDYYPNGKPLFPNAQVISGPYLAMNRIMSETPSLQVIPLGNLPWPTKLGGNTTSLAVVVRKA